MVGSLMAVIDDTSENQCLAPKTETNMELESLLTSSQEESILRDLNVQTAMTQYTKNYNFYNCKIDFHN